jgi:hypothetical protein
MTEHEQTSEDQEANGASDTSFTPFQRSNLENDLLFSIDRITRCWHVLNMRGGAPLLGGAIYSELRRK